MTREEQIIKEASEYADDSNNIAEWGDGWEDYNDFDQVFDAFKNGAKWADEHPKEGLVSIDKACEWWSEWFDTHNPYNMGNCIDKFRKAMEE